MGFAINSPQYRKMQQSPLYWENLGNRYSYFSHIMVAFFPFNSQPMVYFIIWEIHVFSHQFPLSWERQQNSSNGKSQGSWFPHFFLSMSAFFTLDSHPMVYFIVWEIRQFLHQFPMVGKNAAKPIVSGEPGKLVLIFSHSMGAFFPFDSHPMVFFITWKKHWFPHQFLVAQENTAKTIEFGEPERLLPVHSLKYGYSSPTRFPSYYIIYYMKNAWLFPLISDRTGKGSKKNPVSFQFSFPQYYFFYLFQNHSKNQEKKPIK